jgi:hypothetical protein
MLPRPQRGSASDLIFEHSNVPTRKLAHTITIIREIIHRQLANLRNVASIFHPLGECIEDWCIESQCQRSWSFICRRCRTEELNPRILFRHAVLVDKERDSSAR